MSLRASGLDHAQRIAVRRTSARASSHCRHELYPDYKGQRPDMPEEIRSAIPLLRTLLGALAVPVFSVPGVEADDVLGTLAVRGVQVSGGF